MIVLGRKGCQDALLFPKNKVSDFVLLHLVFSYAALNLGISLERNDTLFSFFSSCLHSRYHESRDYSCQQSVVQAAFTPMMSLDFVNSAAI